MALERAAQLQEGTREDVAAIEQTVYSASNGGAEDYYKEQLQVAVQTQREVRGLSDTARKAEYTAQITASKVERQNKQKTLHARSKEQKEAIHERKPAALQEAISSRCGGPDTSRFAENTLAMKCVCSTFPHSNSVNCI